MFVTFKNEWDRLPSLKLLLPLMAGILIQYFVNLHSGLSIVLFSIACIPVIFLGILRLTQNRRKSLLLGISLNLFLISAGILILSLKQANRPQLSESATSYIGIVSGIPKETPKTIRTELEIKAVKDSLNWQPKTASIMLYFEIDSASRKLDYGDKLILNLKPQTVKNSGNPTSFDYAQYLANKGIFYSSYLKSDKWTLIAKKQGPFLKQFAHSIRRKLLEVYTESGFTGQKAAILSALTLGYKVDLSDETKSAFSASGAMHLLAVSGLHVGVIYIVITTVLKNIFGNRKNIFYAIFVIAFLALFALITGLSASVVRASLMFSLISVNDTFLKRPRNTYNAIAASALIILLFNPMFLFDVGFQLSYAAVLSIIYFYPHLYAVFTIKNKYLNHAYSIAIVSLAAQIGTIPFTLYYFKQFPVYFLFTNIIVISIAPLIIKGAIILFVLSKIPYVSLLLASFLKMLVGTIQFVTLGIERLPFSVLQNIFLEKLDSILLVFIIILSGFYLAYRNRAGLFAIAITMLILTFNSLIFSSFNFKKDRFVVYNVRNSSVYNFICDRNNFIIDNVPPKDIGNIYYAAMDYWAECQVQAPLFNTLKTNKKHIDTLTNSLYQYKDFMFFKNKSIYMLNSKDIFKYIPQKKIKTDYLILGNQLIVTLQQIGKYIDFGFVIIDSSIPTRQKRLLVNECIDHNIKYHAVEDMGAFVAEL